MHPLTGMAETITAPSVLKNIDKSTKIRAKNKTKGFLMNCIKNPSRFVTRRYTRYLNPLFPQRVHIQLEGSNAIDAVFRQSVPLG